MTGDGLSMTPEGAGHPSRARRGLTSATAAKPAQHFSIVACRGGVTEVLGLFSRGIEGRCQPRGSAATPPCTACRLGGAGPERVL
jgi:hypothetical protein